MLEANTGFVSGFVQHYKNILPLSVALRTTHEGETVQAYSSHNYRAGKANHQKLFLNGKFVDLPKHTDYAYSLFSEHLPCIALQPALEMAGFHIFLAPQSLEHGKGQPGIDTVITDLEDKIVYLLWDNKRRKGPSPLDRDGYGWHEELKAPRIFLSMGNWSADMGDNEEVDFPTWIDDYVVRNIRGSGSIAGMNQFRSYLIHRIERTLNGGLEKLVEPWDGPMFGIPKNPEDRQIFIEKLGMMHSLFVDLQL